MNVSRCFSTVLLRPSEWILVLEHGCASTSGVFPGSGIERKDKDSWRGWLKNMLRSSTCGLKWREWLVGSNIGLGNTAGLYTGSVMRLRTMATQGRPQEPHVVRVCLEHPRYYVCTEQDVCCECLLLHWLRSLGVLWTSRGCRRIISSEANIYVVLPATTCLSSCCRSICSIHSFRKCTIPTASYIR